MTLVTSGTNSSIPCRLLNLLLFALPSSSQLYFFALLSHTELLRLNRCCRSLRNVIQNNPILWKYLYRLEYLSDAYYPIEWDFVLWCVRTSQPSNPMPRRRMDLINDINWYDSYRRRTTTENNWRLDYANTNRISLGPDDGIFGARRFADVHSIPASGDILQRESTSASPSIASLGSFDLDQHSNTSPTLGDHYMTTIFEHDIKHDYKTVTMFMRGHDGPLDSIDIPATCYILSISRKWALVVEMPNKPAPSFGITFTSITVIDLDHSILHSDSIHSAWDKVCFYRTDDDSATVYTARVDDSGKRLEWALYQFSSTAPLIQLHAGWFDLPEMEYPQVQSAHPLQQSQVAILLFNADATIRSYMIHSVATSGRNDPPRNMIDITDEGLPIPLLREGLNVPLLPV
ncbi:hypothetical protein BDF22DRAFT_742677 [Syncephalis plumigaleata]|nr:hypothetical protein BDF22DRAFT_742677 [Syncephalis plumigaleata]